MKKRFLILLAIGIAITACKQDYSTTKIVGKKRISISDSLKSNSDIEAFIKPFRENVNKDLDSTLAYSVDTYSKTDGDYNTAIGNFMADAILEMCNPIFKSRTDKTIDFVILNHGGIRSIISKGKITSRTAYQVMPFDNSILIAPMKGQQIKDMLTYLRKAKRAHPIANMKITLDGDFNLKDASIGSKPIDYNKIYYVATNDYLYSGGDRMNFLKSKEKDTVFDLNYKIRNLLIDYFKKIDTLQPTIDDRFIQIK